MLKIYGSHMCPDCLACRRNFDHYGIKYEYFDIGDSLSYLHQLIVYRDTLPIYDECKKVHDIGLPTLVKEDGTVFLSWEKYLREQGFDVLPEAPVASACSLDRKGC